MMDRKTREAIDRHIEGPSWVPPDDTEEPEGIDTEEPGMYDLGAEVTQTIAFTFPDTRGLTLLDLDELVNRARYLGPDARVTIGLTAPDRPGAMGYTRITFTEKA